MKNKITKFILLILINFFVTSYLFGEEINFEANSIELIDKDNRIKAKKMLKFLVKKKSFTRMKWITINQSKL